MIGKLKGTVDEIDEDHLVVDVHGVGYVAFCGARTLSALPGAGEAVVLFIETVVREDAIRLYGFLSAAERDWFRLLQTVQGVGAKVALAVTGTLSAGDLANAVALQDKAMVARAPGVGPRVAARIVAELKDKVPAFSGAASGREFRPEARHRRRHGGGAGHGRGLGPGQSRLFARPSGGCRRHGEEGRRRGRRQRQADPAGSEGAEPELTVDGQCRPYYLRW